MKNKLHLETAWPKTISRVRFAAFAILLTFFAAGTVNAQQKVSLNYNNVKLEQVLDDISKQTGYDFFYSREVVDINRRVSIHVNTADLKNVLDELFSGAGDSYRITDSRIYLSPKDKGIHVKATVRGRVTDEGGQPVAGVLVAVVGSGSATSTNANGDYSLDVDANDPVLSFDCIGMERVRVTLGANQTTVNVSMRTEANKIEDVVVTALGITRDKKALGYAVASVGSEAVNATVSSNWLNSLSGKVAGLNFDSSGSGPGGSLRVTLRGEGSLRYDNNTALFVIDGIPVGSDMTPSNSGSVAFNTDAPIDYGNGASDFNPEDIESITVLKGPAATALYGSRAANGAILITTKSGRSTKGLGVTFNSSVTFEKAGFWPDFQDQYGAGNGNSSNVQQQREYRYWSVPAAAATDGIAATGRIWSRTAFGPKFEGQMFYQYESRNWETDTYTRLPWKYEENWYKGLFELGVTYNNSVAIDYNSDKGTVARFSVRDSRNSWIVPNTGYASQNFNVSLNQKINKFINLSARMTYYRKNSDNLPMSGYNNASPLYTLIWSPNVISMDSYWNEYSNGRIQKMYREGTPTQLINSNGADNLYLQLYDQLNTLDRDRVYGNVAVKISFLPELTLDLRSGMDLNNDFRTQQKPWYSYDYEYGFYKEQLITSFEMNTDFLLSYNKAFGSFDLNAAFGGNNMVSNYNRNTTALTNGIITDGVYKIRAARSDPKVTPWQSHRSTNSFYGFVNMGWRNMLFLSITGRNDWTSTLKRGNNSYFYPSVSASVLLDQVFDLYSKVSWVDMLKLRASWANVGHDTDPYNLYQKYTASNFTGSYYLPSTIQFEDLKPENVESYEVGIEAILFNNRISFDVTYYDSATTNQIIGIPVDQITSATSRYINAGKVSNKGVEISATFTPVKTNDWNWTFSLNWAKNWNKLVRLAEGVDVWQLNPDLTVSGNVYIYAYEGTELGRIYGRGYERAPEGAFYYDETGKAVDCSGQVIVTESNGFPVLSDVESLKDFGSIYPDWKAGMTQSLSWKDLSLMMTFTGQKGGNTYSLTHSALAYQGKLTNSLTGRYEGLIHPGVNLNADGTYKKNQTITSSVVEYYTTYVYARENVEMNTFDTSFLKLKEVRLDYSLPSQICRKTKFLQGLQVGVYATNLFCITKYPFYDPEAGSMVGSSIVRGVEAGAFPLTRTYGVNLKLTF